MCYFGTGRALFNLICVIKLTFSFEIQFEQLTLVNCHILVLGRRFHSDFSNCEFEKNTRKLSAKEWFLNTAQSVIRMGDLYNWPLTELNSNHHMDCCLIKSPNDLFSLQCVAFHQKFTWPEIIRRPNNNLLLCLCGRCLLSVVATSHTAGPSNSRTKYRNYVRFLNNLHCLLLVEFKTESNRK